MKTRIVALLMAFICLSLVTCSFAATSSTHKIKTVEKTIKVNSNPSTGYYWVAVYNKKYVKLISNTFKSNNPHLLGSPGIETFKFKGVKGQKITLKYIKSGTKKTVKQNTYTL